MKKLLLTTLTLLLTFGNVEWSKLQALPLLTTTDAQALDRGGGGGGGGGG